MIDIETYTLKNGLRVILHQDKTSPIAVVNTIYNVGARDESPDQTGFAHLFEHLMFGGSENIPNFDTPLQKAGGESNAFTSNDITNYYCTGPLENIETILWLESDRMLQLAFTQKSLDVQKSVVIEEFKQRYINQPYGDVWHEFRPLIYKEHPYQWPTIGKDLSHIENAVLSDVKAFFNKHYSPANAILVIGGNFNSAAMHQMIEKWYGDIPTGNHYVRDIKPEPAQIEYREKTIERAVPSNAIYMAFRIGNRVSDDHYTGDLCSDILSGSKSARFHENLVKNKKLFTQINAYISSGWEHGLFIVTGFLTDTCTIQMAKDAIWEELNQMKMPIENKELSKVKEKFKTAFAFQNQSLLNRCMNIAQFALMDKLEDFELELSHYDAIDNKTIEHFAAKYFVKTNCTTLIVNKK
ncbi:insulinase family protein [Putridiphycobacter roseus]|uniref:Insulinase family protein n=1 Tax=Putridiphycobacter roseus TaxID=2219161 RepID=A0A2W1N203_9FLAO|nr:pitrilysin family protein [Putridiphycobacter roseus]PZE18307.1 insulinase family protein [Putridiphycobacter roseus]